ncbi:hypothetical protein D3C77_94540 [compost metagenome]
MNRLPTMNSDEVAKVRALESHLAQMPQVPITTQHHFHAGVYARTIRIPAGVMLTGALIRIPTLLILSGHATVFIGGEACELAGYHVLPGQAGRKQAFLAHTDTDLTMTFATQAKTVEQAEEEFTAETNLLLSRRQATNSICISGE